MGWLGVRVGEIVFFVLLYALCFFGFGLVRLRFNPRVGHQYDRFVKNRDS